MENIKFDFNDIALVPSKISSIRNRSKDISLEYFPLFTAPMDMVINKNNVSNFINLGYSIAMPRYESVCDKIKEKIFVSTGLSEAQEMYENSNLPKKILIDVANGHMKSLLDISKKIKKKFPNIELMVGNIANPETYELYAKANVDYIRVGIGAGSACTTSANCGIHYPMGSLIHETYKIKKENNFKTKIVADGGFRNFDEIIKALALGADYVMIGGILSKTLESCSSNFKENKKGKKIKINTKKAEELFDKNVKIYKKYRGMSTKDVQRKWNKKELKTSEGISFYNEVEYKLPSWTENFISYLKTAMSYQNKRSIKDFIGNSNFVKITQSSQNRYRK